MFESYAEVRNWVEDFIPLVYGKEELGLKRIENLLEKLGNPEKKFKSIHVGGTSGKGSTSFYISQLLIAKGYKVGLHVSPHLVDIRERMQIDGTMMPIKRFIGLANEVSTVVEDIKRNQPQLTPSYFEILVAMSFLNFANEKVDWAVVEVGLGGRLDATNVLMPEVSVITNVGLDHTEILGDTVEEIAAEKSGIIKNNVPVITGASGNALKVIEKAAKDKKAPLITLDTQGSLKSAKSDLQRSTSKQYYSLRSHTKLFASRNKNLALLTVLSLKENLDTEEVRKAFSQGMPGKFEQIDENVVLDGAHNEDKIDALIQSVKSEFCGNKISLVVAFKKGKNWKKMVDLLVKELPIKEVFATEYQSVTDTGKGSAVPAEELNDYLSNAKRLTTKVIENSQEAVFRSMIDKSENDLLLVTGSLYLVGEARTLWFLPEF